MSYYYAIYKSPLGNFQVITTDKEVKALWFRENKSLLKEKFPLAEKNENFPLIKKTFRQLDEYFAGKRKDFDLPLAPEGTEFQKKAWKALCTIPFGKTASYQEQAKRLKNPLAMRAVGGANNKNPLPILIPCHRVIGKDGKLVGYGGGLPIKKYLLQLEGVL